ncbi:hypothetical protein SBA6_380005 [Candidatus Sulfopaludibacter sp. SbA6]|nr:hypothetical protein SBA6_380005 [Candidatus Sulfopaludibacter sp. SbA6]
MDVVILGRIGYSISRLPIEFLNQEKVDTRHVQIPPGYLPSPAIAEVSPPGGFPLLRAGDHEPASLRTLPACARAISESSARALASGSNVRGALVGRNVLYPGAEDPLAGADAAGGIIHEGWTVDEAIRSCEANRGRDMDRIARHFPIRGNEEKIDGNMPVDDGTSTVGLS